MTLSAPNEPTEGQGGLQVYDAAGEYVGRTVGPQEYDVPSEDLARVPIRLTPAILERTHLTTEILDVEADWLEPEKPDARSLRMNKTIDEALGLQGFTGFD